MSNYPRRSARLSPHLQQEQYQQRGSTHSNPTFSHTLSQPSSTSSSSHPSPVSDGLHPSAAQNSQPRLQIQSHLMPHNQQQQPHPHAPLPSPSAAEMNPFFGRPHSQPNPFGSQPMHMTYQTQQRQQQSFGEQQSQSLQQGQHHQLHPHTNSMSGDHPAHTNVMNPGQLPPDFLAEAAKRAQMACLMRDFGDVSL